MISKSTNGIEVAVETFYQHEYSNPRQNEFMFVYRVSIINHSPFSVKLHSRRWEIRDSDGTLREISGEGVVGMQPTLKPGEEYQYVSGTNLHTDMGKQGGAYLFENLHTKRFFTVMIPVFHLITPQKLN